MITQTTTQNTQIKSFFCRNCDKVASSLLPFQQHTNYARKQNLSYPASMKNSSLSAYLTDLTLLSIPHATYTLALGVVMQSTYSLPHPCSVEVEHPTQSRATKFAQTHCGSAYQPGAGTQGRAHRLPIPPSRTSPSTYWSTSRPGTISGSH